MTQEGIIGIKMLTMTRGLQGSGKSTWAAAQKLDALNTGKKLVVVTKDDIREEMAIKDWNYDKEKEVVRKRDFLIAQALNKGLDVISADTNLAPKHEAQLRALAKRYKTEFVIKDFTDVPLTICIERDAKRDNSLGEKILRETAEKYMSPQYLVPGRTTPQLFVDLDGVLADFDGFIEKEFGIENNRENELPNFWDIVRGYKGRLYYDMKPLPYAKKLWKALKPYNPVILTGCPYSIPTAAQDKREWVAKYIDPDVQVVTCKSRNKRNYGVVGDFLLDDWAKYKALWEEMGGVFLLHKDPDESIEMVKEALGG